MLRLHLWLLAALLAAGCARPLRAQLSPEAGLFSFQTYTPKTYAALPQNWAITQDLRGVMYFGNTDGILEYDSVSWRRIPLSNGSGARALAVGSNGTVYVGGQGEFGFLSPDSLGNMRFVSLLDRVRIEDRHFGDIWNVLPTRQGVYFSSDHRLFCIPEKGEAKIWFDELEFGKVLFEAFGKVYVSSNAQGLVVMEGDRLVACPWAARFVHEPILAAFSSRDQVLLASSGKLYRATDHSAEPLVSSGEAYFQENKIYAVSILRSGEIAVGTKRGGLVLLNSHGDVDRIANKPEGVPSEFVTAIYTGLQNEVWIATSNGLAQFEPALTHFGDTESLHGSVYSIGRLEGRLYVGTTVGLYRLASRRETEPTFEAVSPLKETVWVIAERPGLSLVAARHGLFRISDNHATQIFPTNLVYHVAFSPRDSAVIYTAGHDGVLMLRNEGAAWHVINRERGTGQDFRTVVEDDDGRVWATTRVDIWRLDFRSTPAKVERFDNAQGVPPGWKNAYRFHGHVVFATQKGLMRFSDVERRFVPDPELGSQFSDGSKAVSLLQEDAHKNVWVTGEGYHGVLVKLASGGFGWNPMPLLASGIEETWALEVDADGTAWASGAAGGLLRWNSHEAGDPNKGFRVLLRQVSLSKQKASLWGGSGMPPPLPKLPFRDDALRFDFAAPFYQDSTRVQYQVWLEGSEREWSPWALETRKDYTNLPEHNYRFHVRARTPHGVLSPEATFAFRVLPPWFRTWWAYALYALVLSVAAWLTLRWRVRILRAQNRKLERIVEQRTVELRHQRDQNEALLLNILPAPVASELRDKGAVTPTVFNEVTVCFTDFVGFTLSSESLPADELVSALNSYFTAFDEIMDRYGLEKLKTIGDSYMFASGLPERRTSHAVDAVLAAFEMVEVAQRLSRPELGINWKIRVGLYSGPVVAGVVGKRKFAFDIWGNTVNLASRMESSGVPGRLNISSLTFQLVRDFFVCEPRGGVRIKEGRQVEMHFALAPRSELLQGPVVDGIPAAFRSRYEAAFGALPRAFPAFLLVSEAVVE